MLADATRETFAPYLSQGFRLESERGSLELELVEAKSLASGSPDPERREPFSLLFRGPAEPVLPQSIRRLEHAELGSLEFFLVPVGPDGAGRMLYEAVFS